MAIQDNVANIMQTIECARAKSPNPNEEIHLVAVTKFHTPEEIREVAQTGVKIFAENRVQELLTKVEPLADLNIPWHIIGHLQTNKVRQIIDFVEMVQSLDRLSLAKELEKRAAQKERTIDVLVQVNIAQEEQKFGMPKEDVLPFLEEMKNYPHLKVRGLMLIAPNFEDKEEVRPIFKEMYALFQEMKTANLPHVNMDFLSMGMSGDYWIAIEEGANMVRIGSAIFSK